MQKSPPRYVPTLTQVVTNQSAAAAAPVAPPAALAAVHAPTVVATAQLALHLRQQLLVQTRQYMDIQLRRRISETVSQLALEHAHKMFEELRPQLEATIHQVVEEAVQHAVAHAAAHAP